MLLEKINAELDKNDRETRSDKLYTSVMIAAFFLSAILLLLSFVLLLIDTRLGLLTFSACFYPICGLILVSFYCGSAQILRHFRKRDITFLILTFICLLAVIAFIIYEVVSFGTFYLVPFSFVPDTLL